jgi:sporulation protein YlmC with PRC-barrel domain
VNTRWTISLAACTAVLLWGALRATAAEPNLGQNHSATQGSAAIIRNSTLTGTTVLDPQSRKLGQIKDVLFDSQTGQATFVILDAEAPGSGHAMLVVPYRALRVSINPADNRPSVVLDLRPDQVRAAPQIQNNQWQMLQNPKFLEEARNFYQVRTYYAARPIDTPSTPPPPVPVPQPYFVPQPYYVPQPCVGSGNADPGWTQELDEFSQE